MQTTTELTSTLAKDTIEGLSSNPKRLSSKYFYDQTGSKIFQEIMRTPEYYLTNCEYEIFNEQSYSIVRAITPDGEPVELVELGAGDGLKTKLLIKEMFRQKIDFRYMPIDISEEVLETMSENIRLEFDGLEVASKTGDYFDMMEEIELLSAVPKVILFLGSNIGNFSYNESVGFFEHIRSIIKKQDRLIVGFDLKKDPQLILDAYNDSNGYTHKFNLNLLNRLNKELDADFVLDNFEHAPLYDPQEGAAKSYIVSKEDQTVYCREIDRTFHFKKWEAIYTERSQKFDFDMIGELALKTGFMVQANFTDRKEYFVDSLWKPI